MLLASSLRSKGNMFRKATARESWSPHSTMRTNMSSQNLDLSSYTT